METIKLGKKCVDSLSGRTLCWETNIIMCGALREFTSENEYLILDLR